MYNYIYVNAEHTNIYNEATYIYTTATQSKAGEALHMPVIQLYMTPGYSGLPHNCYIYRA